MLRQHAVKIKYLNVFTDLVFVSIAFLFSFIIRHYTLHLWKYGGVYLYEDYPLAFIIIIPIWSIISYNIHSKYYYRYTSFQTDRSNAVKVSTLGIISVLVTQYIFKLEFFPRSLLLIFYLLSVIFLIIGKRIQRKIIGIVQKKGYNSKILLIVGLNQRSKKFLNVLESNPEWGLKPTGIVIIDTGYDKSDYNGIPVKGDSKYFRNILHNNPVDEVVFAFSFSEYSKISPLMEICAEEGVHFFFISDFFKQRIGEVQSDTIFGIPILYFSPIPRYASSLSLLIKRIIDLVLSITLLIILSPILLIIMVLIKLTSPGSIFYKWKVVGQNKKLITSYKFRTMVMNADELKKKLLKDNEMNGPVFKMENDPRITPIGKFLRKYSLDELPQLYSVIKGDMSLVGPRPPLQSELPHFGNWQRRKLSVKPGITCLWQIRGRNKIVDFDEWVKLDLEYIDNWSLWLDFKILCKTFLVVLKGTGR